MATRVLEQQRHSSDALSDTDELEGQFTIVDNRPVGGSMHRVEVADQSHRGVSPLDRSVDRTSSDRRILFQGSYFESKEHKGATKIANNARFQTTDATAPAVPADSPKPFEAGFRNGLFEPGALRAVANEHVSADLGDALTWFREWCLVNTRTGPAIKIATGFQSVFPDWDGCVHFCDKSTTNLLDMLRKCVAMQFCCNYILDPMGAFSGMSFNDIDTLALDIKGRLMSARTSLRPPRQHTLVRSTSFDSEQCSSPRVWARERAESDVGAHPSSQRINDGLLTSDTFDELIDHLDPLKPPRYSTLKAIWNKAIKATITHQPAAIDDEGSNRPQTDEGLPCETNYKKLLDRLDPWSYPRLKAIWNKTMKFTITHQPAAIDDEGANRPQWLYFPLRLVWCLLWYGIQTLWKVPLTWIWAFVTPCRVKRSALSLKQNSKVMSIWLRICFVGGILLPLVIVSLFLWMLMNDLNRFHMLLILSATRVLDLWEASDFAVWKAMGALAPFPFVDIFGPTLGGALYKVKEPSRAARLILSAAVQNTAIPTPYRNALTIVLWIGTWAQIAIISRSMVFLACQTIPATLTKGGGYINAGSSICREVARRLPPGELDSLLSAQVHAETFAKILGDTVFTGGTRHTFVYLNRSDFGGITHADDPGMFPWLMSDKKEWNIKKLKEAHDVMMFLEGKGVSLCVLLDAIEVSAGTFSAKRAWFRYMADLTASPLLSSRVRALPSERNWLVRSDTEPVVILRSCAINADLAEEPQFFWWPCLLETIIGKNGTIAGPTITHVEHEDFTNCLTKVNAGYGKKVAALMLGLLRVKSKEGWAYRWVYSNRLKFGG